MRKRGYGSLIWGGLLIILGLGLLAENLDLLGDWNAPIWSLILGAFSLVFLSVFVSDRQQWWALIPGGAILSTAVAVFLAEQDLVAGYVVATIIMVGAGVPFLLIFLVDRQQWWALIPGMTMIGIAATVYFDAASAISDEAVGGVFFSGIALGFLFIYLIDRQQWWALIPGGVMGALALLLLVSAVLEYAWPVALIVLGLLLLRGSLGGGRRRVRRVRREPEPVSVFDAGEAAADLNRVLDRAAGPAEPERKRLPTLEEQIAAAIAEEPESEDQTPEPPADTPILPEMPEPPEVPPPPEIG